MLEIVFSYLAYINFSGLLQLLAQIVFAAELWHWCYELQPYLSALPFDIAGAKLIEDPLGGVFLIGGYSTRLAKPLATIFRLSHAGPGNCVLESKRANAVLGPHIS